MNWNSNGSNIVNYNIFVSYRPTIYDNCLCQIKLKTQSPVLFTIHLFIN